MIIYNLTVKVDEAIAKDWLQWLLDVHIPDVLNTKCFSIPRKPSVNWACRKLHRDKPWLMRSNGLGKTVVSD